MLIGCRNLEIGKDQKDNEDIVNAKGFFNKVAGKEFERPFIPELVVNENVEQECHKHPHAGPDKGILNGNNLRFTMENTEVQCQHQQDKNIEPNP